MRLTAVTATTKLLAVDYIDSSTYRLGCRADAMLGFLEPLADRTDAFAHFSEDDLRARGEEPLFFVGCEAFSSCLRVAIAHDICQRFASRGELMEHGNVAKDTTTENSLARRPPEAPRVRVCFLCFCAQDWCHCCQQARAYHALQLPVLNRICCALPIASNHHCACVRNGHGFMHEWYVDHLEEREARP